MRIWAVANQKGGVGKTTTTVTMGGVLAHNKSRTLLIDLDPHGSLSSYLGLDPESVESGVYQLFQRQPTGEQPRLSGLIHDTQFENLFLLPASTAMVTLERRLGSQNGMGLTLQRALHDHHLDFDHIIIDCPPVMGLLMINALVSCEHVIIPVQTEHLAIKGMERMLRSMKMIQTSLDTDLAYTLLPTMYDRRTLACRESLQHLRYGYNNHLADGLIPIDTRLRDASHAGYPLSHMPGNSQALQAYRGLLNEMMRSKKIIDQKVA